MVYVNMGFKAYGSEEVYGDVDGYIGILVDVLI